jgi:hypothetical protein
MQINGEWYLCDDGRVRPILRGEVEAAEGSWVKVPFLVDTGADCTVFSADILAALGFPIPTATHQIGGVGGLASSVTLATAIRLTTTDGGKVLFRGQFTAVTGVSFLDISVLGRDITNLFALIVDRSGDRICLLRPPCRYTIESP